MHKFRKDALRVKIDSLAAESRILRERENSCIDRARGKEHVALGLSKGIKVGDPMPDKLKSEIERRSGPMLKKLEGGKIMSMGEALDYQASLNRTIAKTIRKYVRAGLTKEEILALPGMSYALKERDRAASYQAHRKGGVRHESRHSLLALAFLKGRPYRYAEDRARSYPNWDKVQEIAQRFSSEDKRVIAQRLEQWAQEGRDIIRGRQIALAKHFPQEPTRILH